MLLPYRDIGLAMAVLLPDGPLARCAHKEDYRGRGGHRGGDRRAGRVQAPPPVTVVVDRPFLLRESTRGSRCSPAR